MDINNYENGVNAELKINLNENISMFPLTDFIF